MRISIWKQTGNYYYGARYYNPKWSVWLSVDPLARYNPVIESEFYGDGQHNGGDFNNANLSVYGYCYKNPVKYLDPNGKQVNAVTRFFANLFNSDSNSDNRNKTYDSDVENFNQNFHKDVATKTIKTGQKIQNTQNKIKAKVQSTLSDIAPDAAEANFSVSYTFENKTSLNLSVGLFTEAHPGGEFGLNYSLGPGLDTSSGFSYSGNVNFFYAKSHHNEGNYLLLQDLEKWETNFDFGTGGIKLNGINNENYWGMGAGIDNVPEPSFSISKSYTPKFKIKF